MEDCNKICIIANIGSHYREPIYKLMRKNFLCEFYFGDKLKTNIKTLDYSKIEGYKGTLRNKFFSKFYWQCGSVRLINKPYKYYIMDGEPYCLSSWIILLLSKLRGKTTIAWTHGWYGRESWIKKIIKKIFFSLHDKLLIYSEYAINLMEKEGINPKKMYCIANSLDSDKEKELRNITTTSNIYKDHFNNDHPVLIYCGRIQKSKKLEMLVDSIELLKKEGIIANAVFVGKDIDGVNLPSYADAKNLSKQIWMYGPCYDDKTLSELFYNASVCVSPGNVGLTAIHSLSFGCPVITHNNFPFQGPEFEAIIPQKTGDFFKQGDVHDLTNKIKDWICPSTAQRESIKNAAFQEIDGKWNVHYQIEILKQVFNENN